MSQTIGQLKSVSRSRGKWSKIGKSIRANRALYIMILPVVAYFIIFNYLPMSGTVIAFENFKIRKGILGSEWIGFANFSQFFQSTYFWRLIRNTILLSFYGIVLSFPLPIAFALCLNEIRNKPFKKTTQTLSYLPYFISTVVVVSILNDFTKSSGVLTQLANVFGNNGSALNGQASWFRTLYIGSNLWQHMGYNAIIYIAALAAIDPTLYEAAVIDGANRWQQTLHVTLPGLSSTIVIMLIMRLGQIMNVGYEKVLLMYSPSTYETADIISTYVYRVGLLDSNYSYSTAINLFNSVINLVMLVVANKISNKVSDSGLW